MAITVQQNNIQAITTVEHDKITYVVTVDTHLVWTVDVIRGRPDTFQLAKAASKEQHNQFMRCFIESAAV